MCLLVLTLCYRRRISRLGKSGLFWETQRQIPGVGVLNDRYHEDFTFFFFLFFFFLGGGGGSKLYHNTFTYLKSNIETPGDSYETGNS